jgi:hypothetical protein
VNHNINAALARERAAELERRAKRHPHDASEIPPFTTPVVREVPPSQDVFEGELW